MDPILEEMASALGVKAAPEPPGGWRVSPQLQAQRDREAQVIQSREGQPGGGGAIPTSTVIERPDTSILDDMRVALTGEPEKPQLTSKEHYAAMAKLRVPGQPEIAESMEPKKASIGDKLLGAGEAGLSLLTGGVGLAAGNVAGVVKSLTGGKFGTQEAIRQGEARAREVAESLTYQPRTEAGREALGAASGAIEASKLVGLGPTEGMAIAGTLAGPLRKGLKPVAGEQPIPGGLASVGAQAASPAEMVKATVASASPELRTAVERAAAKGPVNQRVLARHVEADSLPVPVRLTKGQATGDVGLISEEQNSRATREAARNRFNEQNKQLIENVNAIREEAAPDVYATTKPEHGELLIDAYRAKDSALNKNITTKYEALRDANAGRLPLDSEAFVEAADRALHKELMFDHVPPAIRATLDRLKKGGQPGGAGFGQMTFENFESLRTALARIQRSPTADGNARHAAGIIRQALEDFPMPPGAEHLKPLADAARAAARERFALIEKDPAYKAVVNGKASADKFVEKYVVGADLAAVKTMRENLTHDQVAQQTMAAGVMNHLKEKAGIIGDAGNFSQAGYNKALEALRPKLGVVFESEARKHVESLGNVARWTMEQPRGSFVNVSNTFLALMAERAKSGLEGAANVAAFGIPIGTWTREIARHASESRQLRESLQTGAGISLKEIK